MGRAVRMVPADWQHPRYPDDHYEPNLRGAYIPLLDGDFAAADAEWTEGFDNWRKGLVNSYATGSPALRPRTPEDGPRFTEWSGQRPSPDDYMPAWTAEEATHLMMYEDTSEGTPISPAFATPEELARWLADNGASAFGSMTATYEEWLSMARRGWAPSMVLTVGQGFQSGVAALADPETV